MLDKSVPHIVVIMRREAAEPTERPVLPEGYRFTMFQKGDERHWAEIEASVDEFPSGIDALLYFQRDMLPYADELERRCLFVEDADGRKVATTTAWWGYIGKRRVPRLHWVAARPECQGLGLGKAVVAQSLLLMDEIEGQRDIWLGTQTWSHVAIRIYRKFGFLISDEQNYCGADNVRHKQAGELLRGMGIDI